MSCIINTSKVISETIDGETIAINLETGHYFSFNRTGSEIWKMIETGHDREAMAGYFVRTYCLALATAKAAVHEFTGSLESNGLVTVTESANDVLPEPATGQTGIKFELPAFQRFEDMQHMLQADPIHDVDEKGWPILKVN